MSKGNSGHYKDTSGVRAALIQELERGKVKFSKKDIVFITRGRDGKIYWLEKGSPTVGLEHILHGTGAPNSKGHIRHFKEAFGVSESEIPAYIRKVIEGGFIVSEKGVTRKGRPAIERIYRYNRKDYVLIGIGTNGFIVTAYPRN